MAQLVIPRGELATAHLSTNFATTSLSLVDVTGMSVTVTAGTRPLNITVSMLGQNGTAATQSELNLLEDGVIVGGSIFSPAANGNWVPVSFTIRRNPAAGSHVYKLQAKVDAASTATFFGGTTYAADMSVIEV
jgi:hypothetical protein